MKSSIEQYACHMFSLKFGTRQDTRFDKLKEEIGELFEAYEKGESVERLLDEISDVEAVLSHIRVLLSGRSHDESILNAIIKVKVREHVPMYKKDTQPFGEPTIHQHFEDGSFIVESIPVVTHESTPAPERISSAIEIDYSPF